MGTPVNFNGQPYTVPANGERKWGTKTSNLLTALAQNALSKAGGNFTLTADANFGATYGFVVKYIKSVSSNIAASGVVRLANSDKIAFRNNANGADLSLGVSTGDRLQFDSVNIPTISSTDILTNKTLVVANNTVTTAASGNLVATELNAALAELQTDIDTRATSAAPVITGGATVRGTLLLQNTSGAQPELQLSEDPDNGTNKVTIKAPANLSGDYTLTLPTDDGGSNQVLSTDGSGGLSWATVATSPTSTEGDIIYRGASADTRLAGNTSTTRKVLTQTGTGSASAAPAWGDDLATSTSNGRVTPRKGAAIVTSGNQATYVSASSPTATVSRGALIYYQDQDGNHRLKFNLVWAVSGSSRSSATLTMAVTFKNTANYFQAVTAANNATGGVSKAFVTPNDGLITIEHGAATTSLYTLSGDVELESKPSWA